MTDPSDRTHHADHRGPLPDLTDADNRTRRAVLVADQGVRAADAEADRRIRTRRAEADLSAEDRRTRRTDRTARRSERRQVREAKSAARAAHLNSAVAYVRGNAPAAYSLVIYVTSVAVAVSGQISMATSRGWPIVFGVGLAVFVEGLALSMALTAHQQRLLRERALVARTLTWASAVFAAGINYLSHSTDPMLAAVLAASSLAGITVWEIRSGAKNRPELRQAGMLPEPPEQFGWRRWLRYPRSTFAAWSLDVHTRVGTRGSALLANADRNHRARRADRRRQDLTASARRTLWVAALRGPSPALTELQRQTADLILSANLSDPTGPGPEVRAIGPGPRGTKDRRAGGPDPRVIDGDTVADPNVRDIRSAPNDDDYLRVVLTAVPDGIPSWGQVHKALQTIDGLKPSKSRTVRVLRKAVEIRTGRPTEDQGRATA